MKTKIIIKALAFALILTTACSREVFEYEYIEGEGYVIPVTINVTRENTATKATFDDGTKKLSFSTGDKLFVQGNDGTAGQFAGTLTWQSGGTFSGSIYTQHVYTGTANELLAAANVATAQLLPNGYETYGYYSIQGTGYGAEVEYDPLNAFATTKALAVEQFSDEYTDSYSGGFALRPYNSILNFAITGLAPSTEVTASLKYGSGPLYIGLVSGNVTPNASGEAAFAMAFEGGTYNINELTLTVGDYDITFTGSDNDLEAGKIYNITRKITDLSTITANYTASNGETLTGSLGAKVKISIADGATVILKNATISYSSNGADYAGLTLLGDGTLVLADGSTNTIISGLDGDNYSNWPGIFVPAGKTLTIYGNTGVLNAACGLPANDEGSPAGIGAAWGSNCGNIVINGGVINATGGNKGAGIGGCGRRGCGNITINGGTVTAISGELAAGIGLGGTNNSSYADGGTCGDITISGGIIIATGGEWGAGIGTGFSANTKNVTVTKTCGNILISGGTITATGGNDAAGIGTGKTNTNGIINIGTITITNGVTLVTATKGTGAPNSIGKGYGTNITCGTVTIGGVTGAISTSPYTYPAPAPDPLTIEAITAGTIVVNSPQNGMKYSLDGGATKVSMTGYTTTNIAVEAGQKVRFYGNGTSITAYGNGHDTSFGGSGDGFTCKVYGNIMSLLDETGYATATTLSSNYVFWGLFSGNTALTDASGLLLPAMTLTEACYQVMFSNCSNLTAAPELPATTLVQYCYQRMFKGCTSLTSVKCLATSGINTNQSTYSWLDGVSATGTFTKAASATWPTPSSSGIPSGWTVVNAE